MSRAAKDAVFDALMTLPATVTTSDRAVWLWIANRQADSKGYAWCSNTDISAATGLTIGWVSKAVAALEAHGLLAVERRAGRTNRYRIVIPNHRAERGGIDEATPALSAGGPALSAGVPRAERGRNQLENQVMNLPAAPVVSLCPQCRTVPVKHGRWRCDPCQSQIERATG